MIYCLFKYKYLERYIYSSKLIKSIVYGQFFCLLINAELAVSVVSKLNWVRSLKKIYIDLLVILHLSLIFLSSIMQYRISIWKNLYFTKKYR